jgi:hypothetical protein
MFNNCRFLIPRNPLADAGDMFKKGQKRTGPQSAPQLREIARKLRQIATELEDVAENLMDRKGVRSVNVLGSPGANKAVFLALPQFANDCRKKALIEAERVKTSRRKAK